MISNQPVHYYGWMAVIGLAVGQLVRLYPKFNAGPVSPLVWLIGAALIYELTQKFVPFLRLAPITPMQRFFGYFGSALIYLASVALA